MYTVYAQEKRGTDQTSDMNSEAKPFSLLAQCIQKGIYCSYDFFLMQRSLALSWNDIELAVVDWDLYETAG